MVNNLVTRPEGKMVMHLSPDKKWVITTITLTEKRPVKYFKEHLLKGLQ